MEGDDGIRFSYTAHPDPVLVAAFKAAITHVLIGELERAVAVAAAVKG